MRSDTSEIESDPDERTSDTATVSRASTVQNDSSVITGDYVSRLRDTLLNETLLWLAVVALPTLALSLARVPAMGWRPVFGFQILVVALFWLVWFQRRRISYRGRRLFVLLSVSAIGLSGFAQLGPAAISGQFLLLSMVIAVLFMEGKEALRVGLLILAGMLLIGWAAVNGVIQFQIDFPVYAHSPVTWALVIITIVGYGGTVAFLVRRLVQNLVEHQQKLVAANAELAERSKEALSATVAKSRFLATMSHEIRTPMNGILGMAQLLQMPGLTESEQREYAGTILQSGQTLLVLLNDILDLSKIESGKLILERVACEPAQLVDQVEALFGEEARAKNIRLEQACSLPAGQDYALDIHRLKQMLSNLVGNAVKFTESGVVRIEACEVEREEHSTVLEFSVTDTGMGIPPEVQSRLFSPFSQADSSTTRQFGGTGLGLSIVRSLAQLMDGDVGLTSTVGRGSRFWFRIRADRIGEAKDALKAGGGSSQAIQHAGLTGRVLVVDDSRVNRLVVAALLDKLGAGAIMAEDGRQGADIVMRGDPIDLVLMDIRMPGMDGCAATELIRRWEDEKGRPRVPIVALTADAFDETRQRALASGMDDFLAKPVDLTQLQTALTRWLPLQAPALPARAGATALSDPGKIRTVLDELIPLLELNKFSAFAKLKELEDLLSGTEAAGEIADVGRHLKMMRFDLALDHLCEIARSHGWRERTR